MGLGGSPAEAAQECTCLWHKVLVTFLTWKRTSSLRICTAGSRGEKSTPSLGGTQPEKGSACSSLARRPLHGLAQLRYCCHCRGKGYRPWAHLPGVLQRGRGRWTLTRSESAHR